MNIIDNMTNSVTRGVWISPLRVVVAVAVAAVAGGEAGGCRGDAVP